MAKASSPYLNRPLRSLEQAQTDIAKVGLQTLANRVVALRGSLERQTRAKLTLSPNERTKRLQREHSDL